MAEAEANNSDVLANRIASPPVQVITGFMLPQLLQECAGTNVDWTPLSKRHQRSSRSSTCSSCCCCRDFAETAHLVSTIRVRGFLFSGIAYTVKPKSSMISIILVPALLCKTSEFCVFGGSG